MGLPAFPPPAIRERRRLRWMPERQDCSSHSGVQRCSHFLPNGRWRKYWKASIHTPASSATCMKIRGPFAQEARARTHLSSGVSPSKMSFCPLHYPGSVSASGGRKRRSALRPVSARARLTHACPHFGGLRVLNTPSPRTVPRARPSTAECPPPASLARARAASPAARAHSSARDLHSPAALTLACCTGAAGPGAGCLLPALEQKGRHQGLASAVAREQQRRYRHCQRQEAMSAPSRHGTARHGPTSLQPLLPARRDPDAETLAAAREAATGYDGKSRGLGRFAGSEGEGGEGRSGAKRGAGGGWRQVIEALPLEGHGRRAAPPLRKRRLRLGGADCVGRS